MDALPPDLRKRLERAVREARTLAEVGAKQAVEGLAVDRARPHDAMDEAQKALRSALRAHGRQLGDVLDAQRGVQEIRRLVREVAYQHWHRMLFARFLAENDLLIEPVHSVAVTLAECEELARERKGDPWALAASFAERMLPEIFRRDDPALQVPLSPETRQALERLLAALPREVFTADDALGWTYQFWQSSEKDAVNTRAKSGEKITGETLPAVTQLFTEPYMVQFLLHNTIGAWHAGKTLARRSELAAKASTEQELRDAVALPGYAFEYLRFVREPRPGDPDNAPSGPWRPAAGAYAGWPRNARELRVLDPCCGSGHFLVAALDLLTRLRTAEEGLPLEEAIRAVLAENLFGLELDLRCTQIAAFHLALAAWKRAARVIDLPSLHIACSGLGPNSTKEEWLALAEQAAAAGGVPAKRDLSKTEDSLLSAPLRDGLAALYEAFTLAPELGSLIDPRSRVGDMFTAGFEGVQPVLARMLAITSRDDQTHERAVAAHGMARAAQILTETYTLVVTNVPYLGRGSQSDLLKDYAEAHYGDAKNDLATVFVARMLRWVDRGQATGTVAAVTPLNWLFLARYESMRKSILRNLTWNAAARLGPGAFETIGGHVVSVALVAITSGRPAARQLIAGLSVESVSSASGKADGLISACLQLKSQAALHEADGATVTFEAGSSGALLGEYAETWQGVVTCDDGRFVCCFWEVPAESSVWAPLQHPPQRSALTEGTHAVIRWEGAAGALHKASTAHNFPPSSAIGRDAIAVQRTAGLSVSVMRGTVFGDAVAPLFPKAAHDLPAMWCFAESGELARHIRTQDKQVKVAVGSLLRAQFDLEHWRTVAQSVLPDGIPEPSSSCPTQLYFHGCPSHAEPHAVLQVAAARLLGYQWPAEVDPAMRMSKEARALVERAGGLDNLADRDGVVCLPSVRGESAAVDRLRALLARAFGDEWSAAKEQDLLNAAGVRYEKGRVQPTLEVWLRDRFFVEHCALFHNRPFIWHVWDGRDDGFHALVNYQRLVGKDGEGRRTLEALAFTYLGEWIDRQRQHAAAGEEGADGRLAAALTLQGELQRILEGEPPYDVFVRWKALHEQPLGWDPDIDDGARLNIRPFLLAKDVRAKGAGVLRARPDNTWSNAKKPGVGDRGKEPERLRPRESFPWFWGCDPDARAEHRTDFGAGTPGSAPAGEAFTGVRWNGLHYTRAAKAAARGRRP